MAVTVNTPVLKEERAPRFLSYRQTLNWIAFGVASDLDLVEVALKEGFDETKFLNRIGGVVGIEASPQSNITGDHHRQLIIANRRLTSETSTKSAKWILEIADFDLRSLGAEIDRRVAIARDSRSRFEEALERLVEAIDLGQLVVRQVPMINAYKDITSPDPALAKAIPFMPPGWFLRIEVMAFCSGAAGPSTRSGNIPDGLLVKT